MSGPVVIRTAVPWAGLVIELAFTVGVVPSASLSLASTSIVTAVSSRVVAVSFAAVGARLDWRVKKFSPVALWPAERITLIGFVPVFTKPDGGV